MRREWGPWIKTRRWAEFERLAKTDPSQPLADTVAELERGFTEKADRRALRKVLFLLGQAGYRPQEIEISPVEIEPPTWQETAVMVAPGTTGVSAFALGRRDRKAIRWLIVEAMLGLGIVRATEAETPADRLEDSAEILFGKIMRTHVAVPVPVEFARARIAAGIRRTKDPLPSTVAFWRASLAVDEEPSHPAEDLPRAVHPLNPLEILNEHGIQAVWRLELGALSHFIGEEYRDSAEERSLERIAEAGARSLFTPDIIRGRVESLLDLGYAYHIAGRPGSAELFLLSDELKARGAESEYARTTVIVTLGALKGILDRTNEIDPPSDPLRK